jgi:uncharacterized protein (DUF849 family)
MPLRGNVIITCAVTGSIHTPTMSPPSAADAGRDCTRCYCGGGAGGDPASAQHSELKRSPP